VIQRNAVVASVAHVLVKSAANKDLGVTRFRQGKDDSTCKTV